MIPVPTGVYFLGISFTFIKWLWWVIGTFLIKGFGIIAQTSLSLSMALPQVRNEQNAGGWRGWLQLAHRAEAVPGPRQSGQVTWVPPPRSCLQDIIFYFYSYLWYFYLSQVTFKLNHFKKETSSLLSIEYKHKLLM